MTIDGALVSALVLMAVLVTALLFSQRDLSRRVQRLELAGQRRSAVAGRQGVTTEQSIAAAADLVGVGPEGSPVGIDTAAQTTLLAFLSSTCTTCLGFFQAFGVHSLDELAPGVQLVVVTKSGDHEDAARLQELAPAGVTVVMSSDAWTEFEVPLPPYFLLLKDGDVLTEGPAGGWQELSRMVTGALSRQQS